MKINLVTRAEEWIPSTPKHVLLYRAFGWEPPIFAHLPLLLNPDRTKLSKRQGDVAVEDYRRQGYLPKAVVNFIALLGWNPSGSQEKYLKEELVREFHLEKINKAGAVFNRAKLDWLNSEYLKEMPDEELVRLSLPYLADSGCLKVSGADISTPNGEPVAEEMLKKALSLEKPRAKTLAELPGAVDFYFAEEAKLEPNMIPWKKSTPEVAKERLYGLRDFLSDLDDGAYADPKALESAVVPFVAERGWTNAESLWPLRVSLTGRERSPSPFEVAWVLGKRQTIKRIERAINML
jgi:glutamyl/glutaminyl-tRNA synthetase